MIELKKGDLVKCGVFFTRFAPPKQESTAYFFKIDKGVIKKLSIEFRDKLQELSIPFQVEEKTKIK